MNENGVDDLTIDKNIKMVDGFKINEAGLHDTNQVLRYLLRFQANPKDFKFYIKKYRKGERINICVPETRFSYNTELLILMDKKYFPKVNSIDEYVTTYGANIIYNDHFIIAFEFFNHISNDKKIISFYFCPFDIIYNSNIREVFMGLTATSFAKFKYGITQYDKQKFKIVFHEKEQFKELYKTTLDELAHAVEHDRKIILYSTNDDIVTLPFMNMYERLRTVIATKKFKTEDEIRLDDDQLYNLRFKKICNNEPLPQWIYKELFIPDLDYCKSCLRYHE